MTNNKAKVNLKLGGVNLAQWENSTEKGTFSSYRFQKSYYDESSKEWKESDSYTKTDLQNLRTLIEKALNEEIQVK